MTHEYTISGMTCGSCVARVKNELLKLGEVSGAEVKLDAPQAVITMTSHIPLPRLQEAVNKSGHYIISEKASMGLHTGNTAAADSTAEKDSYFPLILLFAYITGASLLAQWPFNNFNGMGWMRHFMAGFFLVFSFFKLMNLRGFAEGYASYDLLARRWTAWGYVYPFVELGLGIVFLSGELTLPANLLAFVVMSISAIGVIQSLRRRTAIQCACLGTVIKLPLGKVTLFEDLLMVAMSAGTIIYWMIR